MRLKLFLLLLLSAAMSITAQTSTVTGMVVNSNSGSPVNGATVSILDKAADSGLGGDFRLSGIVPGTKYVTVTCEGYAAAGFDVNILPGENSLGTIRLQPVDFADDFYSDQEDLFFDDAVLEDEEGTSQGISALNGAGDDVFYKNASYNFSPMYYRFRGLDNAYQTVYINGVAMNDLVRGRFNFSSLLGMTSRAFRNKTTSVGLDAAAYGFGDLGGSVNYNTITDTYAPGFNGSVAYTNSNYMLRGMVTYATGLNKHGWALTMSAIGRYANEGVMEGTFYNSGGLFLSLEKVLNPNHSLTLTAFGGPTQRATGGATLQEAYDLAGSNLYNPFWGYQDGKKRSSRITETYDPTVMLNWLFKKDRVQVNTAVAARWVHYNRSALQYYKANDPNPTYYRYLPSYYADDQELFDLYTERWLNDVNTRQIDWDELYRVNELNNIQNQTLSEADKKGSSYILENRTNNQFNFMLNSYLNYRMNDFMSLQGGVSLNYTKSMNYKTVRDLLGGEFWLDIDPFSDRDITLAPNNLQNDLDNPNRRVVKGDKFGYNYNIYALRAEAWLQNLIVLPHWNFNYGLKVSYTQFQREGRMRNGRAPNNSLGYGDMLTFDNAAVKLGATWKVNGRNYLSAHAEYGTRAPLPDDVYVLPRVKNTTVDNPQSERDLAFDLGYMWNYRNFRGSVTGYYTAVNNATERFGFYDESINTYTNNTLAGVKRVYKGIEVGMEFKASPTVTLSAIGSFARAQYKNNPQATRTVENGLYPDSTYTVYLKNYFLGSTPNTNMNIGIDWAAPYQWFFGINGTWQGNSYVNLAPVYHRAQPDLWQQYGTEQELLQKIEELARQDKLKDAFTINVSIGKLIYINRKVSLNFNLNINNILNNKNIVTYAYQQGRIDTKNWNRDAYPNRYQYAQGIRIFLNAGVRF